VPAATYRLQFGGGFGFAEARELVPYLDALGITDLYASPLLAARTGSPHGYDVTDPTRLNPELGGEEGFAALAAQLRRHGMGLLLDVVANHMAADPENPWWCDVLRHGRGSPFADYFDIDWEPPRTGLAGKVLLPVLGEPYGLVLEKGELVPEPGEGGFWLRYRERCFPLSPESSADVAARLSEALGAGPVGAAPAAGSGGVGTAGGALAAVRSAQAPCGVRARVEESLRGLAGDPEWLDRLLERQHYRPAFWRVANREINYRRFFDVYDLVAVRVEEEEVFAATHGRVLELARAGPVTGLRIDHVDGLRDPYAYLQRLQERLGAKEGSPPFYIVVEKILCGDEELRPEWPVCGTTGYDFLNAVNGLFVDPAGVVALDRLYRSFTGGGKDFASLVREKKRRVVADLFAADLRRLVRQLGRLAEGERHGRDLTLDELEQALVEVTVHLPVYRTYVRDYAVGTRDRGYLERALGEARRARPALERALVFLGRVLLLEFPSYLGPEGRRVWLDFVMRWQQFTGPVMAKGFEDTALYAYNRLVCLNEVGGNPGGQGVSVAEFHRFNETRLRRWPYTLNATSTHDTKRGEDVRARIAVLSEIPDLWAARVERWVRLNEPRKRVVRGLPLPDADTEFLLYQTLLGAWPLREEEVPEFRERLRAYMLKAVREAKVHTGWLEPDEAYEGALLAFVDRILEPGPENRFLQDFLAFQPFVAYYGALNSLTQVLLKIASPGVPDFYRGTELWDFSLVDPDNRRPVDFGLRAALLAALQERKDDPRGLAAALLAGWRDGRVKLYLTWRALRFRRNHRRLFTAGDYLPVVAAGRERDHVCAFARRLERTWALVAAPRLCVRLVGGEPGPEGVPPLVPPLGEAVWGATTLLLPPGAPEGWRNVLTGEQAVARHGTLPLADLLCSFPVALLHGEG
jgi:(1->4)-alpha-D-glucan 1-alpha-D-glucosylmutase